MKPTCAKLAVGALTTISLLGLLATLAGYAANYRYLEILADYRPTLFVWGLICLTAGLALWKLRVWRRGWIVGVACALIVTVVNGWEALPWLIPQASSQSTNGTPRTSIKTIGFNVEGGNTWYSQTREFIRREAPDIAMFCEVELGWPAELASLTNDLPHHLRVDSMDIEVFSRHPIIRTQVFHFGPLRGFVVVGISIAGKELSFVATHTYPRHWMGDEGFRQRTAALENGLGKEIQSFARPLVVMGDLNASPWSLAYKRMMKTSRLQDARKGRGLLSTQHGHGPFTKLLWRPIDHCLHSPDVKVKNMLTGPDLNSDHLPVVAELEIITK